MKLYKWKTICFFVFVFAMGKGYSQSWHPADPISNAGSKIQFVRYDLSGTNPAVVVKLIGDNNMYFYDFAGNDQTATSRAGGFYSTLLTAFSTGNTVYIYSNQVTTSPSPLTSFPGGQLQRIQTVQLGN